MREVSGELLQSETESRVLVVPNNEWNGYANRVR